MENKNLKQKNQLIVKRKKARRRKKVFLLLLFLLGIALLISFKTPIFNINKVIINGNQMVSAEEIVDLGSITTDTNLLYLNIRSLKEKLLTNPFIKAVTIEKKLPKTLVLNIEERKATYFLMEGEGGYILDQELYIIQLVKDNTEELTEIKGMTIESTNPGERVSNSERIVYFLESYASLMERAEEPLKVDYIDISNTLNIQLSINKLIIKLGSDDDLENKLNKAMNTIKTRPELLDSEGYVDVSFQGNPVFNVK